jgi:hypothetical protein
VNETTISNDDPAEDKWIVDFQSFKTRNETQSRVIHELGLMAYEVVRVWLHVATPGAIVREPSGEPIRHVAFPSRSQMRRFLRCHYRIGRRLLVMEHEP